MQYFLLFALLAFFPAAEGLKLSSDAPAPTSQTPPAGGIPRKVDDKVVHLTNQLQTIGRHRGGSARMFSRCPSGMQTQYTATSRPDPEYTNIETSTDGYTYGTIINWDGCVAERVCDFRVHEETLKVSVRDAATDANAPVAAYLPEDVWIHQHRTRDATL